MNRSFHRRNLTVVALRNDDGDTIAIFSDIGDETELIEGICKGILKTGVTTDEGIGFSIGTGVIDLGKQWHFDRAWS